MTRRTSARYNNSISGINNTVSVCQARARLIVRTAGKMFIICPASGHAPGDAEPVSLWSPIAGEGGASSGELASVSVQLAGQSAGQLSFSWLELTPVSRQSALLTRDSEVRAA